MNENRSVFALDGVTGMLIATVLLLSILGFLTYNAIVVQNANSNNFYEIKNETAIGSGIGFGTQADGTPHVTSKAEDHVVPVEVK
ncbi:DUF4006 family protein [Sulfurimonas marina]|uniref:DUF4006 family protein n=1 Tax=Sulfurimonas marina TaxID=2590551 RepID=A0A7M1AXI1_9BACT|nr:DUF4006 family protein [Sulfurimonas marina]QOP42125.1 DUF4006 family protein [Sulfurimonas marina]